MITFEFQVFDLLMQKSDFTARVASNTRRFRSKMRDAGFTLSVSKKDLQLKIKFLTNLC